MGIAFLSRKEKNSMIDPFAIFIIVSVIVMIISIVQIIRYALKRDFGSSFWIFVALFLIFLILDTLLIPVTRVVTPNPLPL